MVNVLIVTQNTTLGTARCARIQRPRRKATVGRTESAVPVGEWPPTSKVLSRRCHSTFSKGVTGQNHEHS